MVDIGGPNLDPFVDSIEEYQTKHYKCHHTEHFKNPFSFGNTYQAEDSAKNESSGKKMSGCDKEKSFEKVFFQNVSRSFHIGFSIFVKIIFEEKVSQIVSQEKTCSKKD